MRSDREVPLEDTTIHVDTDNALEANALRAAIYQVSSYAIGSLNVHINTTSYPSDRLQQRMGLLPVDQSTVSTSHTGTLRIINDQDEYVRVTSDDIEGLSFVGTHTILFMKPHSQLYCNMELRSGNHHVKWKCAAAIRSIANPNGGYDIIFRNKGMFTDDEILQFALEKTKNLEMIQSDPIYNKLRVESFQSQAYLV